MLLADFLNAKTIAFEQRILTREQAYEDCINRICQQYRHSTPKCGSSFLEAILAREQESTMAYASGIAIPHIRVEGLSDTLIGMTYLQTPLDIAGIPVDWVVLIFTDKSSSKIYLNIVAALLKLSQDPAAKARMHALADGHAVITYLRQQGIEVGRDVTIADIMVSNPFCIGPDAPLSELNSQINEHKLAMLPVVDEQMRYLGEAHILDVLKVGVPDYLMMMDDLAFLKSYEPLETLFERQNEIKVRDIMQTGMKVLTPDASIVEAVYNMIQQHRRYFSVVEKGVLVGVVTAMDIFRKVIKA